MWLLQKDIKKIVAHYVKKFNTSNPFRIAKELNIIVKIDDLGDYSGCYTYIKRHKCIFINNNLNEHEQLLVMAHELGHAILHSRTNCYFIRNKTYLLCSRIEKEANCFAVNMLINDDDLEEYREQTIPQLSCIFGINEELIKLRIIQK